MKALRIWGKSIAIALAIGVSVGMTGAEQVAEADEPVTVEAIPAWKSAANRVTLRNDALEASFQSGILYSLKDRVTGAVLVANDPAALSSRTIVFDDTPLELDACRVAQKSTGNSVTTTFNAPDGATWETRWTLEPRRGDLILRSTGKPTKPVEQFRAIFPGCDITQRSVVWANVYGVGRVHSAPWDGTALGDPEREGSPSGHPQPLIALFQGKDSGWVIEGRDPRIAPANVLIKGHGQTATVGMIRRFPVASATPDLYEVRMRTYRDRWENAVDPYVDWMQKGAGFVPIEKQTPSWIKNIETQAYVEVGNFAGLDQLAKQVDPKKTFIGRQPGFTNYGFDAGFPDYRLTDTAKRWFKHARDLGFHVGAHFNGRSVSVMWPELVERMKPGMAVVGKDANGNDEYESIYSGPAKLLRVSAAYKPWRDYLTAALKDAVDHGVDVLYLDETMGSAGKYVVDGMDGLQGTMLLMKQVRETYPDCAVETEQFNPMTVKYGCFALSQMPLGHPLAGYVLRKFVKVVPEGLMYSPVDTSMMDAFDSWGYMLPGGTDFYRKTGAEITRAYQKYGLVPDARMPRYEFTKYQEHYSSGATPVDDEPLPAEGRKLFGLRGKGGVTAYFEKHPTWRGLVVYEPGKEPQRFGARYTNLTRYDGPGVPEYFYFRHTVRDWLIYDDKGLMGLDPNDTYGFDTSIERSPTRFHVTSIPADFKGVMDSNKRIPPQEIGRDDSFFQLIFTANGPLSMVVPPDYDAYIDGRKIDVDPATRTATIQVATSGERSVKEGAGYVLGEGVTKGEATVDHPSVLLAVKREDNELSGLWRDLPWKPTLDSLTIVEPIEKDSYLAQVGGIGRINGRLPEAKRIRITGTYKMVEDGPGPPGDGVVRINGKEVLRIPSGSRPYQAHDFDTDITEFAGQHVLFEFVADGWPGRTSSAVWTAPRIVVEK